jgi:hypothetical protein
MPRSTKKLITLTIPGKLVKKNIQCEAVIMPAKPSKRLRSVKQSNHLSKFEQAKEYGRKVVADPTRTAFYAVFKKRWKRKFKHVGIYQLAIMDFMSAPSIHEIRVDSNITGGITSILVRAYDKFNVSGVGLSLIAPDGQVLESCETLPMNISGNYVCEITRASSVMPGVICQVCVRDIPGNITEKEYRLFG